MLEFLREEGGVAECECHPGVMLDRVAGTDVRELARERFRDDIGDPEAVDAVIDRVLRNCAYKCPQCPG